MFGETKSKRTYHWSTLVLFLVSTLEAVESETVAQTPVIQAHDACISVVCAKIYEAPR